MVSAVQLAVLNNPESDNADASERTETKSETNTAYHKEQSTTLLDDVKHMSKREMQETLAGMKLKTVRGNSVDLHTLLMDTIQLFAAEGDSEALQVLLELFVNFPVSSASQHFRSANLYLLLQGCLFL